MKYRFSLLSTVIIAVLLCSLTSCNDETEYVYIQPKTPDYRAALAALDWGTDTVYTVGHKTPDVDATCSAIAYAELMKSLGYKCAPRVAGSINREMAYVADYFGIAVPQILDSVTPGQRIILTDHSEYAQAVKGTDLAQVIQIIDHHNLGNVTSLKPLYSKVMPVGSSCTVVYTSFQDLNVGIPDEIARVLLSGIISDTRNLKMNHTALDSVALYALAAQLNLDKKVLTTLNRNMNEALHSYTGMTDEEIYLCDYKDYDIEGVKLGIACVDWYDNETMDDFLTRMRNVAETLMPAKGNEMMFAMVGRYKPNPDEESGDAYLDDGMYFVYAGKGAREVAEAAYGSSVGNGWVYSKVFRSRKAGVVPDITAILKTLR